MGPLQQPHLRIGHLSVGVQLVGDRTDGLGAVEDRHPDDRAGPPPGSGSTTAERSGLAVRIVDSGACLPVVTGKAGLGQLRVPYILEHAVLDRQVVYPTLAAED